MASTKTLFQLTSQPTWFENIAIKSDGTIVTTRLDVPEIWAVDPETSSGIQVLRIPFPDEIANQALTGICSLKPDVFAVGAGSFDLLGGAISKPGSWSIWLADLTTEQPQVKKVADMPVIGMINGIAAWDESTVLVTDCLDGKVYTLTLRRADAPFQVGINGIKVHRTSEQTYIYYTTTSRFSVYRVPVTQQLQAAGPAETLASGVVGDDFAVTGDGTVYLCTNISNTVVQIPAAGGVTRKVAGDEKTLELAGATACVFSEDEKVMYVATSGANVMPVDGQTEPAKIVQVSLH
ncbi:hypothetical protein FSHL1_007428 [Fusarium sambucinum]